MSEFFEPPPPPPRREPRERNLSPWMGRPIGTAPGVVALEIPLVRTDRFAIFITRLDAYPEGFGFDVFALAAPGQDEEELLDPMLFGPGRHHLRRAGGEIPDDVLRIGVQFSDGRKATNTGGVRYVPPDFENPPEPPVMHSGVEAAAAAGTGISRSGCGRCRRRARSRSSANGPRLASRSPATRLTPK